jgi:serine/threonine-protein kinase RsbW
MEEARSITLLIDSKLTDVALMAAAAKGICSLMPISKEELYQIELCVVEALNNAIKHSHNHESGNDIILNIILDTEMISFMLSFAGAPIQIDDISAPDYDTNDIQSLPEKGMGLIILNNFMDKVVYQVVGGKNFVTMHKKIKM